MRKIFFIFIFSIFCFARINNIQVYQKLNIYNKAFSKNFYKYDYLFQKMAKKYDIPFLLLKAIALTENHKFNPDKIIKNKDGSKDYGLMQINSYWLKHWKISEKDILKPEINIEVAAKILSKILKNRKYSWNTIGLYHSSTDKFKKRWITRIKNNIKYMIKHDKKYRYVIARN